MQRLATTLALASALGLGAAATATAANPKPFDLFAGKQQTKGDSHAYGTVSWPSASRVHIQGRINDLCPKDGFGSYLTMKINFAGGGTLTKKVADTTGCKLPGKTFSFTTGFERQAIRSVTFIVAEYDRFPSGAMLPGDSSSQTVNRR